ncbi:MATE family efflux transporter DinF [Rheinheimera sp. WS51]|uniref:MATE family efflux transporter DinF n=1 Tax=Rheinheimera sp. WS51 TaxID=3425886 RepID=UPI003D8EDDB4
MLSRFLNLSLQKKIGAIALPMVLSNLCVPLLGLVDTAVAGHLDQAHFLGSIALGSSVISLLFFLLSFLRMSTTGLTAQAYGANNTDAQLNCLSQGVSIALFIATILLLLQVPISWLFYFSDASAAISEQAINYFQVRIWSAPALLTNLVLMGWFLGQQNARYPMWMLIFSNSINIVLDVVFVVYFHWDVAGIAAASVIADIAGLGLAISFIYRSPMASQVSHHFKLKWRQSFNLAQFKPLFSLNRDIFIRSLCLQAVFLFIAFQGAAYGDNIVAANAVLLSFLMLVSYALDGLAYAAESITGQAIGQRNSNQLIDSLVVLSQWCLILAVMFSLSYAVAGQAFVNLLTSIPEVQAEAAKYVAWMILLPLVASWAYLLDGVFIGATQGKTLRNTMLLALMGFALVFLLFSHWQNHALWLALCAFMALRSLGLALVFCRQWQQKRFIA